MLLLVKMQLILIMLYTAGQLVTSPRCFMFYMILTNIIHIHLSVECILYSSEYDK